MLRINHGVGEGEESGAGTGPGCPGPREREKPEYQQTGPESENRGYFKSSKFSLLCFDPRNTSQYCECHNPLNLNQNTPEMIMYLLLMVYVFSPHFHMTCPFEERLDKVHKNKSSLLILPFAPTRINTTN